jgi:hypothetical protein
MVLSQTLPPRKNDLSRRCALKVGKVRFNSNNSSSCCIQDPGPSHLSTFNSQFNMKQTLCRRDFRPLFQISALVSFKAATMKKKKSSKSKSKSAYSSSVPSDQPSNSMPSPSVIQAFARIKKLPLKSFSMPKSVCHHVEKKK